MMPLRDVDLTDREELARALGALAFHLRTICQGVDRMTAVLREGLLFPLRRRVDLEHALEDLKRDVAGARDYLKERDDNIARRRNDLLETPKKDLREAPP